MNDDQKADLKDLIEDVVSSKVTEIVSTSEKRILEDMKQFTEAKVSQQLELQTGEITSRLEKKIDDGLDKINRKIDDLANSVAQAIDSSNDATDEQLKDHEVRITKLEHKAA